MASFSNGSKNSSHWILGSSATNTVTWETGSTWGVAINHHCKGILEEKEERENDTFDAFDGFLDIPGLLSQTNMCSKSVYEITAWIEQGIYHLRRYDDELLKDLNQLSDLFSKIQGECFDIFIEHQIYATAYVLNIVCKLIYGDTYPYRTAEWDCVTKFIQQTNSHHDLGRMMQPQDTDMKQLAELHVKLQRAKKANKLTKMMRLEAFFKLAGRRFHYDHQFKVLLNLIKNVKEFKQADIKKLKQLFADCKKQHEDNEKQSQKNYASEQLSPLSIYGFSVSD